MKKIIALLTAFLVILTSFSIGAFAYSDDDWEFQKHIRWTAGYYCEYEIYNNHDDDGYWGAVTILNAKKKVIKKGVLTFPKYMKVDGLKYKVVALDTSSYINAVEGEDEPDNDTALMQSLCKKIVLPKYR